jgi:hypothetical protein
VSRRTEVLDTPLHRTMTAMERETVRDTILQEARSNAVRLTKGLLVLIAIMAGGYFVDSWLRGGLIRSYGDTSVVTLAVAAVTIAVLVPQFFWLRLLALRGLDQAQVFRTVGPVDERGGLYMRLRGERGERGRELRPREGFHDPIDPEFLWRIDFVRTLHGPDLYYILDAQPIRAATAAERTDLHRFLWRTRVYVDSSGS